MENMGNIVLLAAGRQPGFGRFRLIRSDGQPQLFPSDGVLEKLFKRIFGRLATMRVVSRDAVSCILEITSGTEKDLRDSFAQLVSDEICATSAASAP